MKMKLFLLILAIFSQGTPRIESLSVTSQVQQKLSSITKWLDSVSDATIFDYIYRVNKGIGLNLFEGDIKGYNPKHASLRTAITNRQQLWNTRVVPYIIDPAFDSASRKDIDAAFEEYHTKTCIKFVPRTTEADYVNIKPISGCYSNVGRTGGGQEISLAGPCLKKGTAVHELMHALGFWHEQSRPDRDSWVQIISGNIQQGKSYNFDKLPASEVDTLGVQYDYGSVMHYSKYAFSKNGDPTIIPTRHTDAELGQRDGLSDHDVIRIRTLYRCDSSSPTQPPITTVPPKTKPPVTKPPVTKPPVTNPPVTNPPVTNLPQTKPPVTNPPQTNPPVTNPPQTNPLVTNPPQTKPPVTNPPQTNPPATNPPKTNPPVTNPPVTNPPQTNPPVTSQPQTKPPETKPPVTNPPVTKPPATNPPVTNPPPIQPIYQPGWTMWSSWSVCDHECRHSRYRFCLNYDERYCPGLSAEEANCGYPCKPYISLGCWNEDASLSAMPTAEGLSTELMIPYKDRLQPVRSCADHAAVQGYKVFAIFDGGKCMTGPDADILYKQLGATNMCSYKGTGSANAMNVYSFEKDVDGEWSLWTKWSHCTRSCGLGRQYRYRRCDNPPPSGRGAPCPGEAQQVIVCNPAVCVAPITCGNRYHAGGPGSSGMIWVRDYQNFMECEYQITSSDYRATVSVLIHQIDVEYSRGCMYDSLTLYDGASYRSPRVGTFCGNQAPGRFESSTNKVYIKFESDETNTGHGFTIFYNINSRSQKACVQPPRSFHTTMFMEGNLVGDRIWYSCDPGYTLVGMSPIKCMDQPGFALWDKLFPRCISMRTRRATHDAVSLCTFEESLCGFINDVENVFGWTVSLQNGVNSNGTMDTETAGAHVRGKYLQAESTRWQEPGDLAKVHSSFYGNASLDYCLKFLYKLDGGVLSELRLYTREIEPEMNNNRTNDNVQNTLLWTTTGNDENEWKEVTAFIHTNYAFEVVFEADLGAETGSSASIDDVILTNRAC